MNKENPRDYYTGGTAIDYEASRIHKSQWRMEEEVLSTMLDHALPHGGRVLDVPIGTGRFLELYKNRGLAVTGLDVSADMMAQAEDEARRLGMDAQISLGDATALPDLGDSVSLVVCIRLMTLVDFATVSQVLAEARRCSPLVLVSIHLDPPFFRRSLPELAKILYATAVRAVRGSNSRTRSHSQRRFIQELEVQELEILEYSAISRTAYGTRYMMLLLQRK